MNNSFHRRHPLLLSLLLGLLLTGSAWCAGYTIIKVKDPIRGSEISVVSDERYRELTKQIRTESMLHSQAVSVAVKRWAETIPSHPCPARRLKPRTITRLHAASTMEDASAKIAFMESFNKKRNDSKSGGSGKHASKQATAKNKQRASKRKADEALLAKAYNLYVAAMNDKLKQRYPETAPVIESVPEPTLPASTSTRTYKAMGGPISSMQRSDEIKSLNSGNIKKLERSTPIKSLD